MSNINTGKLIGIFIVVTSLIFAGALYYTQVYAYYEDVSSSTELGLVNLTTGEHEQLLVSSMQATDGTSSPIKFRACFTTPLSQAMLTETFEMYENPTPLTAPGWFDCFDATAIGHALEHGEAIAFLDTRNIHDGVDRVIAVFPDGRAYAWNQLNEKYAE